MTEASEKQLRHLYLLREKTVHQLERIDYLIDVIQRKEGETRYAN